MYPPLKVLSRGPGLTYLPGPSIPGEAYENCRSPNHSMSLSASIAYFAKKRPFVIIKERTASLKSSIRFKPIATMPQKRALEDYPLAAKGPLECALEGRALLNSSFFNKGSAFTVQERKDFGLEGMLPVAIHTLEEQVERAYGQYSSRDSPLAKNSFMTSMKYQNDVLYYKLIGTHIKEMFSVIYTPTEGEAIENYSRLFRRPDGCFLNILEKDNIGPILSKFGKEEDIDYIVVSDGEEILGIGDQGVGGIGISTAKLVLTTLCAGVHPNRTLPVVLDCGTNNKVLIEDELYLGLRQPRVRGAEYDEFIEIFVQAVKKQFPKAMLHFEDFGLQNARRLLEQYRPQLTCFNDDVQGTGVVTMAAIMAAAKVAKMEVKDLRVVMFGAGTAGTGIADQFRDAVAAGGKSKEEATAQVWLVDKPGLLLKSHGDQLTTAQTTYAREDEEWSSKDTKDLVTIIREVKPHVLIGCSTRPKSFTEEVVKEMAKHVERPAIFPLSNPTKLHEASPEDIYAWTDGKALVATGSPFPPVEHNGKKFDIAECNNATAFPGIGLGCILSRATRLSDKMLVAAIASLAAQSPALKDPTRPLLPDVEDVRRISAQIACAVIKQAVEEGLNRIEDIPVDNEDLLDWVKGQMWNPVYRPLKKVDKSTSSRAAKGELGIGRLGASE
ncbi:uncharacterized protein LAJ45_02531 [Morchella importuna]|uniref:uncharacterized protein n=1 Tax=Morchella importuna TaxID=1174673 RepID=UPI001E8D2E1D|nr:uncharacterized protein LAJ45_02531 [Morchella importuna]KAH8153718.1 hypothetical protein LAJ45_02531 [Morchella importuna]